MPAPASLAAGPAPPSPEVRGAVRDLLTASAAFHTLHPDARREIAGALVKVAHTATALAAESGAAAAPPERPALPLAVAQSGGAGAAFSGVATDRMAQTTQAMLGAISFPRFVTELITGVFKAMNDSNQQQMQAYVELVRNVATTTEGFASTQVGTAGARAWLVEHFPAFVIQGDEDENTPEERAQMSAEERAEAAADRDRNTRLVLAPGAAMPTDSAIRAALSLAPDTAIPSNGPEGLVGFARTAMARNRQQMLASMVMMGLQRIVIESGRINAGMRFHIDTRSAASDDRGSSFDERNEVAASGSYGFGPWGASTSVKNTIGYVTTEQTRTTEEMNSSADLNSQVELVFRSDYVPLTRLAGVAEVDRIRVNTLNPDEENRLAAASDQARATAHASDQVGHTALPPPAPLPAAPPLPAQHAEPGGAAHPPPAPLPAAPPLPTQHAEPGGAAHPQAPTSPHTAPTGTATAPAQQATAHT